MERQEHRRAQRKDRGHTVAIMAEGLVRVADQYLRKGSKVYIEGKLQTRKWQDQSGADRYSTEIVLQGLGGTLTMLDGANGGGGERSEQGVYDQSPPADLDDSDIPF